MNVQGAIGVIGSGTMGRGIAEVFSSHGFDLLLVDLTRELLERADSAIRRSLDKQVEKDVITETDKRETLARIATGTSFDVLKLCDLVIEAVSESKTVKRSVVEQIEEHVAEECIIASNTSTISITEIASFAKRPGRIIGMHFMNPAPRIDLVEVISALQTEDKVREAVLALAKRVGKTPVEVKDSPGFVLNRLLIPMINEAVFTLENGVADAATIDACMQLGANHPMGPLALADLVGLDICLNIMEVLSAEFGDPKYRPADLLRRMVHAGYLGRKSGRGFYEYDR